LSSSTDALDVGHMAMDYDDVPPFVEPATPDRSHASRTASATSLNLHRLPLLILASAA
jgi:hypothetical protein